VAPKVAGHIVVFALIVAVIGLLLVFYYFSRLTNARRNLDTAVLAFFYKSQS
jgi:predicted tellurium resistance membrane protein TerC